MANRIDPDIRDFYASQILNAYIISTSQKRITLIDRIKLMLGMTNYTINIDFNGIDMAKKAFELADFMMEERGVKCKPQYVVGIDNFDKNNLSYCFGVHRNGKFEVINTKTTKDENEFNKDIENLSRYYNAVVIKEFSKNNKN